jgi:succinyl-CoA synthetase alpha subunit
MSILVDQNTKVIVQGITGRDGSFHARGMLAYGTKVVGGVTPGKGGQKLDELPVFDSVGEAVKKTGADCGIIFVPAAFASDAVMEAADSRLKTIICITEGVPVLEAVRFVEYARRKGKVLIGPNCPGLISPGKCKIGIMPAQIHAQGGVGVISRSGTLTYEIVYNLTKSGLGQSTCIGIGGDPVTGVGYIELLERFQKDRDTDSVVIIGEIGGEAEEEAADYIKKHVTKKVVAFIAGRTAPPEKKMGHAGAIISGDRGTAVSKIRAFAAAGVTVVDRPDQIPAALRGASEGAP